MRCRGGRACSMATECSAVACSVMRTPKSPKTSKSLECAEQARRVEHKQPAVQRLHLLHRNELSLSL